MHNTVGKIGGDPDLSPQGSQYAGKLSDFINNQNIPGNASTFQITGEWFIFRNESLDFLVEENNPDSSRN